MRHVAASSGRAGGGILLPVRRSAISLAAVGAMALALGLAGCQNYHASAPALPAVASSSSPTTAGAASSSTGRPTLCDSRKPASRDPFPFNRDAARRDGMLHFYLGDEYSGGTKHFNDLDSTGLAALIKARFIDPYDRQNAAPTAWEIFQFLCSHPQVRTMGYVVSVDRPDYRTSLETVYAEHIDAALRSDAEKFCVDAEALVTDDHLECFWD
jgi:hypothetical protein